MKQNPGINGRQEETDSVSNLTKSELWENIGFHRPLAGFFYNLPLYLLTLIAGIAITGFLWSFLYPFPESNGYKAAATGIFTLFFTAFDLGTANIMNRFIGEANIKQPEKMLQYIQYFIWYQMITGLIQTTSISLFALFYVPKIELSYAVWIMIIYSTTQYPGFLGVFRNVLNTLQQYHKTAILNFISGELFQRFTEIGFVLLGRYIGSRNPDVGEIMGIAIGATIGLYIDDFIATMFSARFFQTIMKDYGYSVKDCFGHDFDRDLLKQCLIWGIKSGAPGLVWGFETFLSLLLWLRYVPQYTTYTAFAGFAGSIGSLMSWTLNLGGSISEAFFNGKKKLARYILGQAWRYTGLIQCFMFSILSVLILVMEPILVAIGLEFYILSVVFIFPKMIREIQQPYNNFSENTITGTGHINFQMIMKFLEAGLAILSWFIFLSWLRIPQRFGILSIAWLIPCGELPAIITKVVINYVFINKRVIKLDIPVYQAFFAPGLATLVVYGIGLAYVHFIFNPMNRAFGTIIALIPLVIIFILIIPFFVYFPLTGVFGAWDDGNIEVLRKATRMSGPGKLFSLPMYKSLLFIARKSPLHGKFVLDDTEALEEARDLMRMKNMNRKTKVRII
ncbi:hypothetical protein GF325_12450 [Candidatus Bathyarchaeota archaeon]|nr:hypothetical protein [Candidatus Bathyarchaeota archaeon]